MPKTFFISPFIPLPWLIPCLLALGLFMLWIEWRRPVRLISLRIVAVLLSITALAILLLNASFVVEQSVKPVVLLTPHYSENIVDSLREQSQFDFITYSSDEGIEAYKNSLHSVVGEGIPTSVFHSYPDVTFQYYKPEQKPGITALKISSAVQLQPLSIEGNFSGSGKRLLVLTDPAGLEDSVYLLDGESNFSFKVRPKTSGQLFYHLQGKLNDKVLFDEKLPIDVQPQLSLNILLLQSFPTFETRFLKNYLGEQGHQLAIRYQVSKNVYRYEFVNREEKSFEVTSALLATTDLLIVTEDVLTQMNKRMLFEITQAVQRGLGLLLLVQNADTKLQSTDLFNRFTFLKNKKDSTQLILTDLNKKFSLPTVGLRIKSSSSLQTLFEDADGITAGYTFLAKGKVGAMLVQDTYTLSLGALPYEYASIWQPCIQKISRSGVRKSHLSITTPAPVYVDQPVSVQVISNEENPLLAYQKQNIPLLENASLQQVYETSLWPERSGWNTLTLSDSTKLNFYVHEESEWKSLRRAQQEKENSAHHSTNKITVATIDEQRPVSRIMLFSLLILSWGFLWLSSKL